MASSMPWAIAVGSVERTLANNYDIPGSGDPIPESGQMWPRGDDAA